MARSRFGSIIKRGTTEDNGKSVGVWTVRYPLPTDAATGKRKQGCETVYGTKKDAERRLVEIEMARNCGKKASSITVAVCWREFYLPYISDLTERTVKGYESAMRVHVLPRWGNHSLDDVHPVEVQEWLWSMTAGQARNARATMRSMFNYAIDHELTSNTVMNSRYKMPKMQTRKVQDATHTAEELKAIFRDCTGEPWEAAFVFSAFGGMRREEAFAVKWSDIEWREGFCVVSVSRTVQRISGEVKIGSPKTSLSERKVVIPDPYAARLREIMEEQGGEWVTEDLDGSCSCPNRMSIAYKRWHLEHREHKFVTWKNLRASYSTNLLTSGVDLGMVAKMMGHTRMTTTYEHYTRPSVESMAAVLAENV